MNSRFSKFFCYITWFLKSPDQTRHWTTYKRGRHVKSYCFFEKIAWLFKNNKLSSSSQMNMLIGNRKTYTLISFKVFTRHFTKPFFFEETTIEMQLHCFFCIIPATAPFIEYIKIQVKNFHSYLLIMQIYAKGMLGKLFS